MVYPQEHIVLRAGGHFGTTSVFSDQWSCSIRFGYAILPVTYDAAKLQTFVDAAYTAFSTLHGATATGAGTATYLDWTTAAVVGPDGRYSPKSQDTVRRDGGPQAGMGTPTQPWNTASVVSLRTGIPRGYASNGRVYYPYVAAVLGATTGRVGSATVASRLAVFKTLFDSLNTAANTYQASMRAIVASNVGAGAHRTVTQLRGDDRLDSIERRENQTPPAWSTVTLA